MAGTVGRRERKKAATRAGIADAAMALFVERGFDHVGIREIAEVADVSTATIFKHFPSKEALVFDQDADREAAIVAAVRDRPPGRSIIEALRTYGHTGVSAVDRDDPAIARFNALIDGSEALREYSRRMWLRHEDALAAVIIEQAPTVHPATCRALAHYFLEIRSMLHGDDRPSDTIDHIFVLLEHGWNSLQT